MPSHGCYVLMRRPESRMWACRVLHVPDSMRAGQRMDRTALVSFEDRLDAEFLACRHLYRTEYLGGTEPPLPRLRVHEGRGTSTAAARISWEERPAWVLPPPDKMEEFWTDPRMTSVFDVESIPFDVLAELARVHEMGHVHILSGGSRAIFRGPSEQPIAARRDQLRRLIAHSTYSAADLEIEY